MEATKPARRRLPKGMKVDRISPHDVQTTLEAKIAELRQQPEFQWQGGRSNYALDADGSPAVRVAVAQCGMDFDLWKEIRNPAMVGLFPVGFRELWEFYANNRKRKTDEAGRSTIFQIAQPFEEAANRFRRAIVISAMLPADQQVFETYNSYITEESFSPWDGYAKAWGEIGQLLDRGITRLAFDLTREDRVVIPMNNATVKRVSTETVPATHQGASHGVCKGGNYSQKSIAVMTGLGQFGVSRIVFRDEAIDGSVKRYLGALSSIVMFDQEDPDRNGSHGVFTLTPDWRRRILDLSDFTKPDTEINRHRFCTYIREKGEPGCGKCIAFCPSGALANSSPLADGHHAEAVARQQHRFWDGAIQFDNGRCCDERGQLANLYDEWMCGRCVSICGGEGNVRPQAAAEFDSYKRGQNA